MHTSHFTTDLRYQFISIFLTFSTHPFLRVVSATSQMKIADIKVTESTTSKPARALVAATAIKPGTQSVARSDAKITPKAYEMTDQAK